MRKFFIKLFIKKSSCENEKELNIKNKKTETLDNVLLFLQNFVWNDKIITVWTTEIRIKTLP